MGFSTALPRALTHGRNGLDKAPLGQQPVVVIEGIASGTPHVVQEQSDAASRVAALFAADSKQRVRIPRIFAKSKIKTRHMAVDATSPAFDRHAPIQQRMRLFAHHAVPLAVDVCRRALAVGGVTDPAQQIGVLVLATSTGFAAPEVDIALITQLGLAPTVARVNVSFMGCAAAMNALRVAADYARGHAEAKALVCCVELPSVNAVFADDTNDIIISSLFADGCSAMVVGSVAAGTTPTPGSLIIRRNFSSLVSGSLDGISLALTDKGVTCRLSPSLPSYIYSGLGPVVDEALAAVGLSKTDIHLWAIHPGGPRIIEESLRSLGLATDQARYSWDVLAEFGNMLSVSLPVVLQRMAAAECTSGVASKGVAFSFAPGIVVEGMVIELVPSAAVVN